MAGLPNMSTIWLCEASIAIRRPINHRRRMVEPPPVPEVVRIAYQHTITTLGMCTWAALHSIPQQRLAVLQVLLHADKSELAVSEIARRAGCHRQVARFALEELECVGITRGPDHGLVRSELAAAAGRAHAVGTAADRASIRAMFALAG
jgi:hypothetical protein